MAFKQLYKEVIREYEKDLLSSKKLLENHRREVYEKSPEIQRIDETLIGNGINIAKSMLSGDCDVKKSIEHLRKQTNALQNRKAELLDEAGFPPDYLTDIYKCKQCKDTGFVEDEKCSCFKQKLLVKYYNLSNLQSIIEDENFDTFDIRYYGTQIDPNTGISPNANIKNIYQNAIDFVRNFDNKFVNLLIYGETGLGKTFLCNCIAKDLIERGKTVLYLTAPQIFKKIEEYRFNREDLDDPDNQIEMIYEVDLLIIDDLGSEFSTVITLTELFNIVNTRLLQKKHTIFSTNLTLNDLQNSYTDRIISRFLAYYKMMGYFGDDIRVKKKLSY